MFSHRLQYIVTLMWTTLISNPCV